MIASDDLPDILRPIGGIEQTLIRQGGALALDDLRVCPECLEEYPAGGMGCRSIRFTGRQNLLCA